MPWRQWRQDWACRRSPVRLVGPQQHRRRDGDAEGRSAVLRLMTSSNLVGCWTGRSLGFAPFKILSDIAPRPPDTCRRGWPRRTCRPPASANARLPETQGVRCLQGKLDRAGTRQRRLDDDGIYFASDHCRERTIEIGHTADHVDLDLHLRACGRKPDLFEEWPRERVRWVCECRDAPRGR